MVKVVNRWLTTGQLSLAEMTALSLAFQARVRGPKVLDYVIARIVLARDGEALEALGADLKQQ